MATEFRLGYTGAEINQKLAKVDEIEIALENEYYTSTDIDTKIDEVNTSIEEVNTSINEVNTSIDEVNTSIETSLKAKADLIGGKVPLEQLPDNIGSGGGLTEVDWETNVVNKPFYDTRVRSYYSQAENPNPVSFDFAAMNNTFYKVSDLVLTKEQILNKLKCVSNNADGSNLKEFGFLESGIQMETDEFIFVVSDDESCGFIFANTSGILNFTYSGYDMSFDIPEVGIYLPASLGEPMPEYSFEFICGGELKTLDLKYLPEDMALGYDTRRIYHFDSNKTPNPPSFSIAAFGVNGYKVFDLTPTLEEFFNYKIIYNSGLSGSTTEITFTSKQIQLSWDDAWMIQSDQNYAFALCRSAGTLEADYQGISVVCEVPEPGIYLIWNAPPTNTTLEINLGGELKQIDPKFIPADLDFNLDDYYTKSETYSKSEIDNLIGDVNTIIDEIDTLIGA